MGECAGQQANYDLFSRNVRGKPRTQRIADADAKYKGALDACTQRAEAQLEDVRTHGNLAERQEQERQKQAALEQKQQAELQARVDALRSDPKIVQLAYSGLLCGWTDDYNAAIHEVGEYHKAAKIGGVLDLGEVNRWQDEAMRARRHQATARAELKQAKLKPLPCKDPTVAKIAHCITDEVRGAAECEGTQDYVLVAGGE